MTLQHDRCLYYVPALDPDLNDEPSSSSDKPKRRRRFTRQGVVLELGAERQCVDGEGEATRLEVSNAVSSEMRHGHGLHVPTIDVDHHCALYPSSTPGHYHLYIETPMSWRKYRRLLKAMVRAGIVEPGYYKASLARKATFLRRPDQFKDEITSLEGRAAAIELRNRLIRSSKRSFGDG